MFYTKDMLFSKFLKCLLCVCVQIFVRFCWCMFCVGVFCVYVFVCVCVCVCLQGVRVCVACVMNRGKGQKKDAEKKTT